MTSHKKIGTLLPLSSIRTEENKNQPNGTIDDGLIFLDWLTKTGQSAWQMLPLHETHLERDSSIKHVLSPYKGYGIGLDPKYASAIRQQPATSDLEHFLSIHNAWLPDYALFCALRDHFGTDKWVHWEKNSSSNPP
jgi:4-alpha-glucanotransferase